MISKGLLPAEVLNILRDQIVHMEYPPETSLSEKGTCEEFKMS
jgi:DNA-binding GntR family transcriptional regulator